jgi:class 3 adenylate cyclase
MEQQIRFCKTADGVRLAYITLGQGPTILIAPGWISHIQLQLAPPTAQAFFEKISRNHTIVFYDKYGCGLSERNRTEFSLESEVHILERVVDHLKLKRFILFGLSQSGPVAIAYAVKHPRRVSHLLLYDTYACGKTLTKDEIKTSLIALVRSHWGFGSKTLTDLFVPGGGAEEMQMFSMFQREAATAEMAAKLLELSYSLDVTDILSKIHVPTLVMHRRGDRVIPFRCGREMAAMIPNVRFVPLEGDIHLPNLGDSEAVLRNITEFLGDPIDIPPPTPTADKFKRKLVAILCTDVKDYSRLMGEDEEGTLRALKAHKEVITRFFQHHRGRVVGTAGDSLLAEFASVVNAVQCAVEIQKEMQKRNNGLPKERRMEFRIGINMGDVIEEGDSIYGDGVNIAARLESLAEAGGICISGVVHDQIEKKLTIKYQYVGDQSVKNIERPIQVYRILNEPRVSNSREATENKS